MPLRELLGRLRQFPGNLGVSVAHDERRYARRASRELLELYQLVHREHPELSGRELYIAVVARRLGPNASNAADIVPRAAESFTDWPVERELKLSSARSTISAALLALGPRRRATTAM